MAQFYPCLIFKRDIILLTCLSHEKKCYLNSINQLLFLVGLFQMSGNDSERFSEIIS